MKITIKINPPLLFGLVVLLVPIISMLTTVGEVSECDNAFTLGEAFFGIIGILLLFGVGVFVGHAQNDEFWEV